MGKALNQVYKADASVLSVATSAELKINGTVMVEVKDGVIVNTWDTEEKVLDYLG